MRQVRWAGWMVAIAAALGIAQGRIARADITSDKPAALLVYPKVVVDTDNGKDTVIRLANTNKTNALGVHCFYLDANSHCSGGTDDGDICSSARDCSGGGFCVPSWQETDFDVVLTAGQPIEFKASDGLSEPPLGNGVCVLNPFKHCGSAADCSPFPGGDCTQSNASTLVPPVPEDPFVGELKCIVQAISTNTVAGRSGTLIPCDSAPNGSTACNVLKGEALLESTTDLTGDADFDVASYNALGVQATGLPGSGTTPTTLTLGGSTCSAGCNSGQPCVVDADCPNGDPGMCTSGAFTPGTCVTSGQFNGCPATLILSHFFDEADDPVPGTTDEITTDITLVPCSEDLLRQVPGAAVVQYLVFNEFEQRFSTSKAVRCFQEIQLCNIDTTQCSNSIFNVGVAGTLTGQTRLNPIGVATTSPPSIPSGLLGIAIEKHSGNTFTRSAAFNLGMSGGRDTADVITIP